MFGSLTYLVFSQLAVGGSLSILLVPREAGKTFFRFCSVASLALLVIALAASDLNPVAPTVPHLLLAAYGLCTVVFTLSVICDRQSRRWQIGSALVGATALLADGVFRTSVDLLWWASVFEATYALTSALFLGSVIYGMVLGHWYLVLPTLPVKPLKDITGLMILSLLAKAVLTTVVLFVYFVEGGPGFQETISSFIGVTGFFFWARVLFGLLGPAAVCYMTWETVKINSTQSATGLLYVATILVLIGEPVSRFIYLTTSLPV
ncbi:MAG: hypothetical protein CME26_12195 [Gemmatimonadetes bacterium]|nr:hypothetical protein [Gemmatimonadota bacterium]|tara:strand:+ start:2218 stop:3006 length:789 start_codon:yes stop_codon:yes gene_type:complete